MTLRCSASSTCPRRGRRCSRASTSPAGSPSSSAASARLLADVPARARAAGARTLRTSAARRRLGYLARVLERPCIETGPGGRVRTLQDHLAAGGSIVALLDVPEDARCSFAIAPRSRCSGATRACRSASCASRSRTRCRSCRSTPGWTSGRRFPPARSGARRRRGRGTARRRRRDGARRARAAVGLARLARAHPLFAPRDARRRAARQPAARPRAARCARNSARSRSVQRGSVTRGMTRSRALRTPCDDGPRCRRATARCGRLRAPRPRPAQLVAVRGSRRNGSRPARPRPPRRSGGRDRPARRIADDGPTRPAAHDSDSVYENVSGHGDGRAITSASTLARRAAISSRVASVQVGCAFPVVPSAAAPSGKPWAPASPEDVPLDRHVARSGHHCQARRRRPSTAPTVHPAAPRAGAVARDRAAPRSARRARCRDHDAAAACVPRRRAPRCRARPPTA